METPSRTTLQRRRIATDSNSKPDSPEFEFWRVNSSSFQHTPLHSADQLFSDGFLLPLHLHQPDSNPKPDTEESEQSTTGNSIVAASKRWKEIFRRGEKKATAANSDECNLKSKKKKIRNSGNSSSAELNINLWPFSRSRSAGNNSTRSKPAPAGRKVSSAPCSRSNSKSSGRSWPVSPGRTGVYIARSSPVVQLRRKPANSPTGKGRVLNLSSGSNGNLFSLRGLFSKKSALTV